MLRHRVPHQSCADGSSDSPVHGSECIQYSTTNVHPSSRKWMFLSGVLAVALVVQGCVLVKPSSSGGRFSLLSTTSAGMTSDDCMVSFGTYNGHQYTTRDGGTIGTPKCLVESKWMKVQQHQVRMPGSSNEVIDDWLWIDYHDRINVLVEDENSTENDRRFLVFEQTKYALEGRTSLAIIGGIIEPREEPRVAAEREVEEEMGGMQCQDFNFLVRYRTDVNRGIGWVNSFLATHCSRRKHKQRRREAVAEEVGAADTERQDLKSITLTELRESSRRGDFLEVQWSNTVALALQHPEISER